MHVQAEGRHIAQGGRRMLCGTSSGKSDGGPQPASDARGPGMCLTSSVCRSVDCPSAKDMLSSLLPFCITSCPAARATVAGPLTIAPRVIQPLRRNHLGLQYWCKLTLPRCLPPERSLLTAGATAATQADAFLPQSYSGPTMATASGATVPRTPLVDTYPTHGVAYGLPLHAAASTTYNATRPYKHT